MSRKINCFVICAPCCVHFRKRNEARLALAEGRGVIDKKRKTCMLYLQADHLFYEAMGSEEACIETMTRHVQRVNR